MKQLEQKVLILHGMIFLIKQIVSLILKDSNIRFYGVDYGDYIIFKHKYNHLLRGKNAGDYTKDHWTLTQKQFDVYT